MPDENHDGTSLDRIRSDRGLARPSGFIARRTRELAQRARDLQLVDDIKVVFPDKHLEAVIREDLEKPEGPITRRDLRKLSGLRAERKKIENISGLEHAANLTELDLSANQIGDISPLASLTNLTTLKLSDNRISDVSPLASLTKLTWLNLMRNPLDLNDIQALRNRGVDVLIDD